MKSATKAEPQEFDDMMTTEPEKPDRPRFALRRPDVESEVDDENEAPAEDVHDGGRMQETFHNNRATVTVVAECAQIQKSYDDELRRPALPQPQRARR